MVFLDITTKTWKIKSKSFPVIENIPMKDLKWFKEKYKEMVKKNDEGKLTQLEALDFDDLWWKELCKIGLKTTMDDVLESNCTEREFRDFMAELYNFLSSISTIEEAKLSVLYDRETKTKESKQ